MWLSESPIAESCHSALVHAYEQARRAVVAVGRGVDVIDERLLDYGAPRRYPTAVLPPPSWVPRGRW